MRRQLPFINILLTVCMLNLNAQVKPVLDSLEGLLEQASDEERITLLNEMSEVYWQQSYDTSLLLAMRARQLAEEVGNDSLMANALNMIGNAYWLMADYPTSVQYHLDAVKIREALGDSSGMAKSYNNLGAVHLQMQNDRQALQFFKKSAGIFRALGDDYHLFSLINNNGAVYASREKYDSAYFSFKEAHKIAVRTREPSNINIALTNLGDVTMKMGRFDESEIYQLQALELCRKMGDKGVLAPTLINLGGLYIRTGKYDAAFEVLDEAIGLAEELNSLIDMREAYLQLYEYYRLRDNYKEALSYYRQYAAVRDSIISQETMTQIREMELRFNASALEQEIELLRKDNEIQQLRQNRLRYGIILLGVLAVTLILLLILLMQRNRIKKESNRLLEDKNRQLEKANQKLQESEAHLRELNSTKDKFFSIIGHDLRNPLNALLGFSELISGNSDDYSKEEIQKYSRIINEAAKNIHMLIENLLEWSRSQSGNIDFNPGPTDLPSLVREMIKVFAIQADKKEIELTSEVRENTTIHADRNLLSTVLRNLINNAVKFTEKGGKVVIRAEVENDVPTVSIQDSGIGMSEAQLGSLFKLAETVSMPGTADERGTGLGLILCKEFVDMHGGKIWAESEPGKGSIFHFSVPAEA